MVKILSTHVKNMVKVFPTYIKSMFKIWTKYALGMVKVCIKNGQSMSKIWPKHVKNIVKVRVCTGEYPIPPHPIRPMGISLKFPAVTPENFPRIRETEDVSLIKFPNQHP